MCFSDNPQDNEDDTIKKKRVTDEEIAISEMTSVHTAPPKPKNTLPNLNPPGSQLSADKVSSPTDMKHLGITMLEDLKEHIFSDNNTNS